MLWGPGYMFSGADSPLLPTAAAAAHFTAVERTIQAGRRRCSRPRRPHVRMRRLVWHTLTALRGAAPAAGAYAGAGALCSRRAAPRHSSCGGGGGMFVQKLNPLTGSIEWAVAGAGVGDGGSPGGEDALCDDPIAAEPLALTSYLDMLNDAARNAAYLRGVARSVRPGDAVLDVGAGTGLLAMLASRAGASDVSACELSPVIAALAKRTLAANGMLRPSGPAAAGGVRLLAARSDQLSARRPSGGAEAGVDADLLLPRPVASFAHNHDRAVVVLSPRLRVPRASCPGAGQPGTAQSGRQRFPVGRFALGTPLAECPFSGPAAGAARGPSSSMQGERWRQRVGLAQIGVSNCGGTVEAEAVGVGGHRNSQWLPLGHHAGPILNPPSNNRCHALLPVLSPSLPWGAACRGSPCRV